MFIYRIDRQKNVFKLLCVDEANEEHFVIVVFPRNNDFDLRGYAYMSNFVDSILNDDCRRFQQAQINVHTEDCRHYSGRRIRDLYFIHYRQILQIWSKFF